MSSRKKRVRAVSMRVGVVGLGVMGKIAATRLLSRGIAPYLYNRTKSRLAGFESTSAVICESPAEMAANAGVILTFLTGRQAMEDILFGDRGIISSAPAGTVVVDLSTQPPAFVKDVWRRLRRHKIGYLEAAMTGSVHDLAAGSIGFLAGGSQTTLEKATPALKAIGGKIYHFGPVGSGATAKLAMNLLVGGMAQSLAESFALLKSGGLDYSVFLDALQNSGLSSPLYGRIGQRHIDNDFRTARFSLSNLLKDTILIMSAAREAGLRLPVAQTVFDHVSSIKGDRLEYDYSSLIAIQLENSGVDLDK